MLTIQWLIADAQSYWRDTFIALGNVYFCVTTLVPIHKDGYKLPRLTSAANILGSLFGAYLFWSSHLPITACTQVVLVIYWAVLGWDRWMQGTASLVTKVPATGPYPGEEQ